MRKALAKEEEMYGPDDSRLARSFNDFGAFLSSHGKSAEAEQFYRRVLGIWESLQWPDEKYVDTVLANLFASYLQHEQYEDAVGIAKLALSYTRRILGPRHLGLVPGLNNLAIVYREWGKHDEAERVFDRAIQMADSTMGPRHPQLPDVLRNYARLRRKEGRRYDAEKLEREARRLSKRQKRRRK